jgi:hypothetical protein
VLTIDTFETFSPVYELEQALYLRQSTYKATQKLKYAKLLVRYLDFEE